MSYELNLGTVIDGVANGLKTAGTHSARAAAAANAVSAAAQTAQGTFNQGSVNNANAIGSQRIMDQYGYNSGQAAAANAFTQMMWDKSAAYNSEMWDKTAAWNEMMWQRQADWNEMMFGRQMEFNHNEAEINRNWSKEMENTRYQRAMADMEKAGLNPILAYGGIATGAGSGGAASVGGASVSSASMSPASMSGASGAMASGGLLNGLSASEGNYTGQMEYMGGMLGLFGAAVEGISSAVKAMGMMGKGSDLNIMIDGLADLISSGDTKKAASKEGNPEKYNTHSANEAREGTYERQYKQHWKDYWQRKGLAGDYD